MKSRKLPMEKRKTPLEVSVTFTKRRQGLFNKAAKLSLLCDAQIAVLASSPNNHRVYSFTHSSVPSVISAFLRNSVPNRVPIPVDNADFVISNHENLTGDSRGNLLSVLDTFEGSESVEELENLVRDLEKVIDEEKRMPDSTDLLLDTKGFDSVLNNCNGDELMELVQKSTSIAGFDSVLNCNGDELMELVQKSTSIADIEIQGSCDNNVNGEYWSLITSSAESHEYQFLDANNYSQDMNIGSSRG